jgi:uncharacterized protein
MNRLVSNLILGFFVLALMAVYGFAKQPTVYSMLTSKNQPVAQTSDENTRRIILPNGTTVTAQIASTTEEQAQGLAGVTQLESSSGMLFVFAQPGAHAMWMKGMKTSIDMVWLDNQGKVVYLATRVPVPAEGQTDWPTYTNSEPATYVLELAAGTAESAGITEGTQVNLS